MFYDSRYNSDETHTNLKSKNTSSQENHDIESWGTSTNVARGFCIDSLSDEDSEFGVVESDNNRRLKSYWDGE